MRNPLATHSLIGTILVGLVGLLLAGCSLVTGDSNRLKLVGGAGGVLPSTLLDEDVTDSTGTWNHRLVATEGSLRLADGHYEHSLTMMAYFDGQLGARNVWNDQGEYTDDRGVLSFESQVIENVAFSGIRAMDVVIIEHDLYHLTGEHDVVPLEYGR